MQHRYLPEAVSLIAAEQPTSIALQCPAGSMTYADLDARSNQVARVLRRRGVGPETIVGLRLARSAEFVVGALGILKAGAAYLPLDPSSPAERTAFIANDAALRVIVGDASDRVPSAQAEHLSLDGEEVASEDPAPLALQSRPDTLAYVIYTSGSTGRPKGVLVEHHNLSNLVDWHCRAFGVGASDRAALFSSPSFDAAVWEIWPYLATGGTLCLSPDQVRQDPGGFRDWLLDQRVSIGFVPTLLAEALLELDWPASAELRFLLTGADVLRRYPRPGLPFQLVNNYGPTECTVVSTSGVIPPGGDQSRPPSIGRPITNAEVLVLDHQAHPVRPGDKGELYIGGAGVARGYLNRPELTEERFVHAPDGRRLYRTGDICRLRLDGELDFIGRVDDQIKVHGYRVELGEISWALEQHPAVRACSVVPYEDGEARNLVAYLVPNLPQGLPAASELREFLLLRLPAYMLPSAFVEIEALPLTASGKVDRSQLPAPTPEIVLGDGLPQADAGLLQRLADLVAELLGLERVSSADNFFLLGGHSLFAAQLSMKIRDVFGVELPLRTVFDIPTVAGLAGEVDRLLINAVQSLSEADARRLIA